MCLPRRCGKGTCRGKRNSFAFGRRWSLALGLATGACAAGRLGETPDVLPRDAGKAQAARFVSPTEAGSKVRSPAGKDSHAAGHYSEAAPCVNGYLVIRYTRSLSVRKVDSTEIPIFLPTVPLMKPRTLCACQSVPFINSFNVTPPGRFSRSRILAVLLPWRAVAAFLGRGASGQACPWTARRGGRRGVGAAFRDTGLLFRRCRRLFSLFFWIEVVMIGCVLFRGSRPVHDTDGSVRSHMQVLFPDHRETRAVAAPFPGRRQPENPLGRWDHLMPLPFRRVDFN